MNISFDEKKIVFARKILFSRNKGVYSDVFNLFKNEINELIEFGLKYRTILSLLENELDYTFKYKTFISWIRKNIKQNNNLRKNSQKEEIKKKETNEVKQKQEIETEKEVRKKKNKNWKDVIFPQIEAACEGMKKANLRT